MRVLFLSQIVPYPPHGGVLQRGYHLLRELGRCSSVHLLAFVHPDVLTTAGVVEESRRALGSFCENVEYFRLWPKASTAHRMAAVAASAASRTPFSVIAHRSSDFRRRVTELLGATRFDILHADTIALCQFVEHRRYVPAVLTHHNIESTLMVRRAAVEPRRLAAAFLRREAAKLAGYEARYAPRYEVNVVVSREDERALLRLGPTVRTALVPNGVDVTYFTPDPAQEGPAIVYTGGMNMFANRDAVLYFLDEVWPLVLAASPALTFYVVGQNPPAELLQRARQDRRIVVTGYVDDIRPLVRKSSVYVVPLRVGGGTRLKVLDAMAMGKALVSTSVGCEGIDVTPGEHLLVADTPPAFARAVLELLGSPARRLALGRAGRALVESRYSWGIVAENLLNAYRQAIVVRRGDA